MPNRFMMAQGTSREESLSFAILQNASGGPKKLSGKAKRNIAVNRCSSIPISAMTQGRDSRVYVVTAAGIAA